MKRFRSKRFAAAALAIALLCVAPGAQAETTVRLRGGGWGHGLGFSQYGGYGRALNGRSATRILRHYYRGTRVRRRKMPSKVRVGLLQYRKVIAVEPWAFTPTGGAVHWRVQGRSIIARGAPGDRFRVVRARGGKMRLYKNGNRVRRGGRGKFGGPDHPLVAVYESLGTALRVVPKATSYAYGRMYFGTFATSACDSTHCLRLVVTPDMQEYLYGLAEMPASWPAAALRAQAIAGRTYALEKIRRVGQRRDPCDCALYDSVADQAYAGDTKRTGSGIYWQNWKSAVDNTARRVIVSGGAPIQALYMSSSGGHTENNENVWGGTPIGYLRGVPDGPDGVDVNPDHDWTVRMPWSRFSDLLNRAFSTGRVQRVRLVRPFGVSGRVTVATPSGGGVRIVGANRTVRVDGWSVRSALGLKDTLFRLRVNYDTASTFAAQYAALSAAPGEPVGVAYAVPRRSGEVLGRAQDFETGRMTRNFATGAVVWQRGPVLARYDASGREAGPLGMPLTSVRTPRGYAWARYDNGLVVHARRTGAHIVGGRWAETYLASGGPSGPLGLPVNDVIETAAGRVQRFENGELHRIAGQRIAVHLFGA